MTKPHRTFPIVNLQAASDIWLRIINCTLNQQAQNNLLWLPVGAQFVKWSHPYLYSPSKQQSKRVNQPFPCHRSSLLYFYGRQYIRWFSLVFWYIAPRNDLEIGPLFPLFPAALLPISARVSFWKLQYVGVRPGITTRKWQVHLLKLVVTNLQQLPQSTIICMIQYYLSYDTRLQHWTRSFCLWYRAGGGDVGISYPAVHLQSQTNECPSTVLVTEADDVLSTSSLTSFKWSSISPLWHGPSSGQYETIRYNRRRAYGIYWTE